MTNDDKRDNAAYCRVCSKMLYGREVDWGLCIGHYRQGWREQGGPGYPPGAEPPEA